MKEILQNEGVFTKNCKKHIAADIEEGEDICTLLKPKFRS